MNGSGRLRGADAGSAGEHAVGTAGRAAGPTRRTAAVLVGAVLAVSTLAACGSGGARSNAGGDDPRGGGRSAFDTTAAPQPTSEVIGGTTAPTSDPSAAGVTTTTVVPTAPGDALLAAVAAFRATLGPSDPTRTLRFTVHFPVQGSAYASLQSQDPVRTANVDERDWRDGVVGPAEPVTLTGSGMLDDNLFALGEVDWNAIAAALPTVPDTLAATTGPLANSSGVTHLIATKDLPFSPRTVVRVYVDGGDRSLGGYVQLLADGTVDKVQA